MNVGFPGSDRWRCVSLRWGLKDSNGSSNENLSAEFTSAFVASLRWRVSPSIHGCRPELLSYLDAEDITEALSYAAWRAEEVEVPLRQP